MVGRIVRLVDPTPALRDAFLEMAREGVEVGEPRHEAAIEDFDAYLERLRDLEREDRLPDGYVPSITWWLVEGDRVLGTTRFRPRLVPHLEHEGGHIGYEVRPSARGKGYGTRILALALDRVRERGLPSVLITCDSDNVPSVRVIERNGGWLLEETVSERTGVPIRRYRIDLG